MGLNGLEDYSLLYSMTNWEGTLWGHIFFKTYSALGVPQLENTITKENQNSRCTMRQPHDTGIKCASRTYHVGYSQQRKRKHY